MRLFTKSSVFPAPLLTALLLALAFPPPASIASNFLPLNPGTTWELAQSGGAIATVAVMGQETLLGRPATRIRWTLPDQTYENFWTRDAQGRVFLQGARNLTFPAEFAYTPALLYLDPPMVEGQTWTTTGVVITDFSGGSPGAPIDITFGAGFVGTLVVPAGSFAAVGIGQAPPPPLTLRAAAPAYDALGRHRTVSSAGTQTLEPDLWFSDGVGFVQMLPGAGGDPYRLVRYAAPIAVEPTTWGRMKALFAASATYRR